MAEAGELAWSPKKIRPLLLVPPLMLPLDILLMHLPLLHSLHTLLKACLHLKMKNLLWVPLPLILILLNPLATNSPDHTVLGLRTMKVMIPLLAAKELLLNVRPMMRSMMMKTICQPQMSVLELQT